MLYGCADGDAGGNAEQLKKLGRWYALAAKDPDAVSFDADEVERIIFCRLVLLGVQPSEVEAMDWWRKWDVLAIAEAQAALARNKMPGE